MLSIYFHGMFIILSNTVIKYILERNMSVKLMKVFNLSKKKIIVISLGLLISVSVISTVLVIVLKNPKDTVTFVEGSLNKDTTWSGLIHVSGSVFIPINITLTILPGTTIEFRIKHCGWNNSCYWNT